MRIYNAYFGKLPYTRIAMTQQPRRDFGQAWPTTEIKDLKLGAVPKRMAVCVLNDVLATSIENTK